MIQYRIDDDTIDKWDYKDNDYSREMSDRLRGLLHRTFDFIANPRHAKWQAGRNALCTIDR